MIFAPLALLIYSDLVQKKEENTSKATLFFPYEKWKLIVWFFWFCLYRSWNLIYSAVEFFDLKKIL